MTDARMDELRALAIDRLERGDYDDARNLYRAITSHEAAKDDLANLVSVENQSLTNHLRVLWESEQIWFVGFLLAGRSPVDEAGRLYTQLLEVDSSPEDRWRVQCKRIELTIAKGVRQPGLVSDFFAAWDYLAQLGPRAHSLEYGMAKSLVRGDNDEARAFLVELLGHSRCPEALRALVSAKVAELDALGDLHHSFIDGSSSQKESND